MQLLNPATIRVDLDLLAQFNNANIIPIGTLSTTYTDVGTTTSTSFVTLFTNQYTIDINGVIDVVDIFVDITTNNTTNGRLKMQISGDGGSTWVDITNEMAGGTGIRRTGPGLWINNVLTGLNKLQIRVLGRSADGLLATLRVRNNSFFYFIFNKKII